MSYHIDLLDDLVNGNVTDDLIKIKENFLEIDGSRIVEHNLNILSPSNGYYVRWENGLQVAWFRSQAVTVDTPTGALYARSTIWTFPAAFVVPPYVIPGAERVETGSGAAFGATYRPTTNTAASLVVYDAVLGKQAFAVAIAIGRWK